MMKRYPYFIFFGLVLNLFLMLSCSKWDDYKKYTREGETVYTGKMDSVKVYSGYLRVRVTGLLPADPKIVKCLIAWSGPSGKDSVVFAVSKAGAYMAFDTTFSVQEEGTKNFTVQTFDKKGNASLPVDAVGTVYGPDFEGELPNRPVINASFRPDGNKVVTNWDLMDASRGPLGTAIHFVNNDGDTVSAFLPLSEKKITLDNYKPGTYFTYRTLYLPDSTSIDTLYSKTDSLSPVPVFSNETATIAFNSFYNHFYSTEDGLFYSTTAKNNIGSGWAEAVFFDMALDNYARTKAGQDLQRVRDIYQGAYYRYSSFVWNNIKNKNGWIYDDMMWWVIALLRGYNITGESAYLDTAKAGFGFVWNDAYDPSRGAMLWSWKIADRAYNACINYPTVIAAMMLYNITGDDDYLEKAKKIYTWARSNLFRPATGRVADHVVNNDPPGFEDYTYNQGTCIGAAVLLYKATGEAGYLDDALKAADYTKNKMSNARGILPAEGDYNEQGVLKAIFAQYIYMLIYDAGQDQYLPWIKDNISAAWNNRDALRNLMYRDYTVACPTGTIQSYEASSGVAFMQLFNPEIGD